MRKLTTLALIIGAIFLAGPVSFAAKKAKKPKWEKIKKKWGITVYKREVPGSNHVMFRGKGAINKEMIYVLSVIADLDNLPKWIERLKSVEVLKVVNERERILYNVIDSPWPLQDRDVVVHGRFKYDEKNDWIHLSTKETTHQKRPKVDGNVRIPYMRALWSLKPIKKGKATWVEFKVTADPGGIIPAWVSNMASKDVPFKSIVNLRERVRKGKFNQEVIDLFKEYRNKK